ncbi:MAG TPA: hypothetical protein VLA98_07080, partial [Solirubrobacteraceae bacterium]|nr:hypothetical protein [Solirubrobacteraceae bacterium]
MGGMLRRAAKSPSLMVALIALAVALGGTSYAALKLPANSVGPSQIKNGAVRSPEVKDRSLRVRDFSLTTRAALKGPPGERGPQGVGGGGTTVPMLFYRSTGGNVIEGEKSSLLARCLEGEHVTGGGADVQSGDTAVVESYPKPDGTGWWVTVENNDGPPTE